MSAPGAKTPQMLEVLAVLVRLVAIRSPVAFVGAQSLLQLLANDDETLTPTTRAAAVANWMRLFDARWPLLQRMLDDYTGLVRRHLLQVRRLLRDNVLSLTVCAAELGVQQDESLGEVAVLKAEVRPT